MNIGNSSRGRVPWSRRSSITRQHGRDAHVTFPSMRRRGTAMIEFIFTVPLLGLVLMLTFFFGWSMTNQQRVKTADRYAAWRGVHGGGAGGLNRLFFRGQAVDVDVRSSPGTFVPQEALVQAAGEISAPAGQLAEQLALDTFPGGERRGVSARFTSDVRLWRQLASGPIHSHHSREGVEWRRREARCEQAIQDQFLDPLDRLMLDQAGTPAEEMASELRRLWRSGW